MDTLITALNVVTRGAYIASVDLKHGYYTTPIAYEQRKFLKSIWKGQLYEFRALPMGLASLSTNFKTTGPHHKWLY